MTIQQIRLNTTSDIEYLENKANQYQKENDKQFKKDKENINFKLRGNNKYYYARQCRLFAEYIIKNGYQNKNIKEVSFNNYSINNGYNQYCEDIKRFNSKDELLGFVIGFNEAVNNY